MSTSMDSLDNQLRDPGADEGSGGDQEVYQSTPGRSRDQHGKVRLSELCDLQSGQTTYVRPTEREVTDLRERLYEARVLLVVGHHAQGVEHVVRCVFEAAWAPRQLWWRDQPMVGLPTSTSRSSEPGDVDLGQGSDAWGASQDLSLSDIYRAEGPDEDHVVVVPAADIGRRPFVEQFFKGLESLDVARLELASRRRWVIVYTVQASLTPGDARQVESRRHVRELRKQLDDLQSTLADRRVPAAPNTKKVERLLVAALGSGEDLQRFAEGLLPGILAMLPTGRNCADLAADVVRKLMNHGLLDEEFWSALATARPRRMEEVDEARLAYEHNRGALAAAKARVEAELGELGLELAERSRAGAEAVWEVDELDLVLRARLPREHVQRMRRLRKDWRGAEEDVCELLLRVDDVQALQAELYSLLTGVTASRTPADLIESVSAALTAVEAVDRDVLIVVLVVGAWLPSLLLDTFDQVVTLLLEQWDGEEPDVDTCARPDAPPRCASERQAVEPQDETSGSGSPVSRLARWRRHTDAFLGLAGLNVTGDTLGAARVRWSPVDLSALVKRRLQASHASAILRVLDRMRTSRLIWTVSDEVLGHVLKAVFEAGLTDTARTLDWLNRILTALSASAQPPAVEGVLPILRDRSRILQRLTVVLFEIQQQASLRPVIASCLNWLLDQSQDEIRVGAYVVVRRLSHSDAFNAFHWYRQLIERGGMDLQQRAAYALLNQSLALDESAERHLETLDTWVAPDGGIVPSSQVARIAGLVCFHVACATAFGAQRRGADDMWPARHPSFDLDDRTSVTPDGLPRAVRWLVNPTIGAQADQRVGELVTGFIDKVFVSPALVELRGGNFKAIGTEVFRTWMASHRAWARQRGGPKDGWTGLPVRGALLFPTLILASWAVRGSTDGGDPALRRRLAQAVLNLSLRPENAAWRQAAHATWRALGKSLATQRLLARVRSDRALQAQASQQIRQREQALALLLEALEGRLPPNDGAPR